MIAALALATTVTLTPTDDVWVYPHASDPARDETVRLFGAGGRSTARDAGDLDNFAYGYLRFLIPEDSKGKRLVGATLEVTNVANPEISAADAKASPIEVRPLTGLFDEKAWVYTDVQKVVPDPKIVFGSGSPVFEGENPAPAKIDLLAKGSTFASALIPGKPLALALVSAVDASEVGMKRIYKIYTKEAGDVTRRPRLVLTYAE